MTMQKFYIVVKKIRKRKMLSKIGVLIIYFNQSKNAENEQKRNLSNINNKCDHHLPLKQDQLI